ncbi:SDR family NAD(P)-dependent oxidoreductase [Paenibacillus alvei]|uniref:SDR family NAD(P)-dependent oxidoreductase n=1 Tax=Paenibacillus alvei TaxID=44250 RepID=UPI00227DABED|nr:SDR family NAD(P)-dependent oxidoreductase [Paenibacillus alvei]
MAQEKELYLIPLSARTKDALNRRLSDLLDWLGRNEEQASIGDIAYTLAIGREHFAERCILAASDTEDLKTKLQQMVSTGQASGHIVPGTQEGAGEFPLMKLGRLYIEGRDLDWPRLYANAGFRKIPLPVYSFARERVPVATPVQVQLRQHESEVSANSKEALFYVPNWVPADLRSYEGQKPTEGNTVIVFHVGTPLATELANLLGNGNRCILVKAGDDFQCMGDEEYKLVPGNFDHCRQLLLMLYDKGIFPNQAVFMESAHDDMEDGKPRIAWGGSSVFAFSKVLMQQGQRHGIRLLYVYMNNKNNSPLHAAVGAFCRTIHQENPHYRYSSIEIDPTFTAVEASRLIRNELVGVYAELEIKFALQQRFVKRYREIDVSNTGLPYRERGVYLISGGLGGLGIIISRFLAEKFRAKLILIGRSELDVKRMNVIRALEEAGSEVFYLRADMSDYKQVNEGVKDAKRRFGRIDGVFHAAGIYRNGFILHKSEEDFLDVLSPKLNGAIHLDRVLIDEPLQFFALFSSTASVFGKVGQSDYAYANSFLDHFAIRRQKMVQEGKRFGNTVSVNWPLWEDGGMQISALERTSLIEQGGIYPLPSDKGIEALSAGLLQNKGQLMVLYGTKSQTNVYVERKITPDGRGGEYSSKNSDVNCGIHEPPKLVKETCIESREDLLHKVEQWLAAIIAEEIGLSPERVEAQIPFENYGIDSIIINRFNAVMEEKFLALPKTLLFEYRNIREVANYLLASYREQLLEVLNIAGMDQARQHWQGEYSQEMKMPSIPRDVDIPQTVSMNPSASEDQIAIIGVVGRYPQAKNLDEFWRNLKEGRDCITEIPPGRWDCSDIYDPNPEMARLGKIYCKWGGFIDDIDRFDPLFFNISPKEAETMDPQERMFLETVWALFEDAGYTKERLMEYIRHESSPDIGVFVGTTTSSYNMLGQAVNEDGEMVIPNAMPWSIANRVSYVFNFCGPSMPVDTACSSSLTAVHLACESLKKRECRMAVAGGVNIYLHPSKYATMCQLRMLSKDGKCRSFGLGGNGFVPGEGVGAILLKPLSQAIRDGDHIYAVIKSSSINHGGRTNGYTVPNPNAQAALVTDAIRKAGIDPRTLGYIEAHGTGTALGDPIEISGLTKAFRSFTVERQFCSIGSVKSNIGHLESAAGIAGITKILLQMKHRYLVPSLHVQQENPNIEFEDTPFYVQKEAAEWKPSIFANEEKNSIPRRASVSSFGAGGVNVHIILEEYSANAAMSTDAADDRKQILVFSARNQDRLQQYAGIWMRYLNSVLEEEESDSKTAIDDAEPSQWLRALFNKIKDVPSGARGLSATAMKHFVEGRADLIAEVRLHLLCQLQLKGLFTVEGEQANTDRVYNVLGALPGYRKLIVSMLELLTQGGFLQKEQQLFTATNAVTDWNIRSFQENGYYPHLSSFCSRYPELEAWAHLAHDCISALPKVISGKEKYTDILFPSSSMEKVEPVYRGNEITDYYNRLVAICVLQYVEELLRKYPDTKIRILEIGAGTGGTSRHVMESLARVKEHVHYFYTDVSAGFTQYGKRTYHSLGLPYIEYQVLNIEKSPEHQGFDLNSMDIVFATNALHATRNMRRTLKHAKSLLKPSGLFIVNEVTRRLDYATLSFGLTDGWWLYEEEEGRIDHSPLLTVARWKDLLVDVGFGAAYAFGLPEPYLHESDQHVIVSGAVLRKQIDDALAVPCLRDIAFTLQTGREAMEERLAVVGSDIRHLRDKLQAFITGKREEEDIYVGNARRSRELADPFFKGKEGEGFIHTAIQDNRLDTLARLWVMGAEVDWTLLWNGEAKRISLPTYPFERGQYWIPQSNPGTIPSEVVREDSCISLKSPMHSANQSGKNETLFYYWDWIKDGESSENTVAGLHEDLLVFCNQLEDGLKVRHMVDAGSGNARVFIVIRHNDFKRIDDKHYEMNIEREHDYTRLFEQLSLSGFRPGNVLHLLSFGSSIRCSDGYQADLETGFYSVVSLCRQWYTSFSEHSLNMAYAYPGDLMTSHPEFSAIAGFARSLTMEQHRFSCVIAGFTSQNVDLAARCLLSELGRSLPGVRELLYGQGVRYTRKRLEYALLDVETSTTCSIKSDGIYLITGGAGGLGLMMARYFAQQGVRQLLLTGRSKLQQQQREQIQEIAKLGCRVEYWMADIGCRSDVERLITNMKERFGAINGIIHAAGVVRDCALINKDRKQAEQVIHPKVYGTIFLDEVTRNETLDFFVMFSSLASVLGNSGQTDYAFANSFMDFYAEYRHAMERKGERSGKTLAIQWPYWQHGGMRMNPEAEQWFTNAMGFRPMPSECGWQSFLLGLQAPCSQLAVMHGDAQAIRQRIELPQQTASFITGSVDVNGMSEYVHQTITDMTGKIVKIRSDSLDPDAEFGHYGFDSNSLMQLINSLNAEFELQLMPSFLYEYTTIRRVSDYIVTHYGENVQQSMNKLTDYQQLLVPFPHIQKDCESESAKKTSDPKDTNDASKKEELKPIAIIGVSGVFPHAENTEVFWNNLINGIDCIGEVPNHRWDWKAYYGDPLSETNKTNIKWGGFIEDEDKFDSLFFRISPREAAWMDPQQRLFLETVWKTIEDAGYRADRLSGSRTGLFVGVSGSDYHDLIKKSGIETVSHSATGTAHSILANRISYLLDWRGPSEPIDTACSSSLVAIKRAVDAIRHDECDMAIAGGVNLLLDPELYVSLSKAGMLSGTGRCRTFDEGANGYARSEGAAAILLKPLERAVADGDQIYAVIRGIDVNHGGSAHSLTAPNPAAQAEVIERAWIQSGIDPSTVSYIETHGTGTKLGDPVEIEGLKLAFKHLYERWGIVYPGNTACGLGSVKTSIGHLEPAAGIASVVKVMMAMKHGKLPGNIHFQKLNPYIELGGSPFYIVAKNKDWISATDHNGNHMLRRAGISSFGFGGVNAHLVLEEHVKSSVVHMQSDAQEQIVVLSAKDEKRLKCYAEQLLIHLNGFFSPLSDKCIVMERIQEELLTMCATTLDMDRAYIGADEGIDHLGAEPIHLLRLMEKINEKYQLNLNHMQLDGYPSVAQLSKRIVEQNTSSGSLSREFSTEEREKEKNAIPSLASLAYTLQVGRVPMEERVAFVVSSVEDLCHKLQQFITGGAVTGIYRGKQSKAGHASAASATRNHFSQLETEDPRLLAEQWAAGAEIDWENFNGEISPAKVSLPTYPFMRQSHWILPRKSSACQQAPSSAAEKSDRLLLSKVWKRCRVESIEESPLLSPILIIANKDTEKLAEWIAKRTEVVLVTDGNIYSEIGKDRFSADLQEESHALLIMEKLEAAGHVFSAFVDISDLHRDELHVSAINWGKISLLQWFVKRSMSVGAQVLHFTQDLQAFASTRHTLAGANFAGIVKMLSSEYRKVASKTIDLDRFPINENAMLELIRRELKVEDNVSEICYRDGERYYPEMMEVGKADTGEKLEFSSDQVYVITGGTRGIGAELARHFVKLGATKLVIMGKSYLPDRSKWEMLMQQSDNVGIRERESIRLILELEGMGASIRYYCGSLTDKTGLRSFFDGIRSSFGEIAGVVHCAGARDDTNVAFIHKQAGDMQKVFEPKIDGLQLLHEILSSCSLQFFVLFSSVAGTVPTLAAASSDYANANAFMDYFAEYQHKRGNTYYLSLAWPSWKETGMGEVRTPAYTQMGFNSLSTAEGLRLFEWALRNREAYSLLLPCTVQRQFDQASLLRISTSLTNTTASNAVHDSSTQEKRNERSNCIGRNEPESDIKGKLKRLFAAELNLEEEQIDDDVHFSEYGVDSILLSELVKKAEMLVGGKLEPSIILEYPTIAALSEQLAVQNARNGFARRNELVQEGKAPLKLSMEKSNESQKEDSIGRKIAVIGMACQFPQSPDLETFWQRLIEGADCITEVPKERWDTAKLYSKDARSGKSISKWGGFLQDIESFDPRYFKIREELAAQIDPGIRKFLEVCDQALRDAGYLQQELSGRNVGVYAGARMSSYCGRIKEPLADTVTGSGQNFIAGHVSHFFNFKGPNVVVDSACSSSLVSLHLACQSLLAGESEMALAGGVDILLDEQPYLMLSQGRALSPDGRCRTFDEGANGFVPGEGCGAVLLKPLRQAVSDGDRIYAVIEATAVNNDGHTMGITTPNPEAQMEVIEKALDVAGVSPESITYIETHGTGTMIGDPIELRALTNTFRKYTNALQYCGVGSVKTNIGHLLSAAGIASFIKTALAIHNGHLPPTLHCSTPNPRFQFSSSPFYPVTKAKEWMPPHGVRMAGISSFGFGGTNAHVILSSWNNEGICVRSPLPKASFNKGRYWIEAEIQTDEHFRSSEAKENTCELPLFLQIIDESGENSDTERLEEKSVVI